MKNIIVGLIILSSILLSPVNAKEQLTATIIGSGSPIYNENRASASVLISASGTHILVDMGNGTQANLSKLNINIRNLSALFFTHHHLDHNEEFVPIFIRALMGKNDFSIVGPPNTTTLTKTNLDLYKEDIDYRLGRTQRTLAERQHAFDVSDIKGGESFKINDILVSTIKVPHTIHTIAYRFDYQGQSIVITGDLTYSHALPELAKNADYMIIDSGGMVMVGGKDKKRGSKNNTAKKQRQPDTSKSKKSKVRAHLNLADSSDIAEKAKVKNLVYTHLTPGVIDTENSLKEIKKNYHGKVIFAEDLMVLNAPKSKHLRKTANNRVPYAIIDTGQRKSYSNNAQISDQHPGDNFYGQDSSYTINEPSYTDNKDGTITDNITGLTWQKNMGTKLSFKEALGKVKTSQLANYNDWRIPTIKELYSLIQFTGRVKGQKAIVPFIDTNYFDQPIGNVYKGEREIDAQTWSKTEYVGKTMKNDDTVFGVNFVDGRIKGYPKYNPRTRQPNKMYFRLVRGNINYGKNHFVDNGNSTISDTATGLMWQKADSNKGMNWQEALHYAENSTLSGHSDWRLPNAKELQSIVDYTRSPETSHSAAINPIFQTAIINNEGDEKDYPYYWSSTTHLDGPVPEKGAVYIAFGKALGEMRGDIMDVHGAGSQRSDPKTGKPMSRGPQGDMIRVDNYVRLVRGGQASLGASQLAENINTYPASHFAPTSTAVNIKSSSSVQNKFINRLDKNGDKKVSRAEFKHSDKQFNHFDKNNDGYISISEAPTGPPKR